MESLETLPESVEKTLAGGLSMCTVIFIPTGDGCRLGTNRDELRTRAKGTFPAPRIVDGLPVLGPRESSSGSWTCANAAAAAFALLNWHPAQKASAKTKEPQNAVSRGTIVESAAGCRHSAAVETMFSKQPLPRIRPFRLLGIFNVDKTLREWLWDGKELSRRNFAWEPRLWASSSLDEKTAQQTRQAVFQSALSAKDFGSLHWLRSLHRTHLPEKGPFSICMHRKEASTLSYTETEINRSRIRVRHLNGPPCASKNPGNRKNKTFSQPQEREIQLANLASPNGTRPQSPQFSAADHPPSFHPQK